MFFCGLFPTWCRGRTHNHSVLELFRKLFMGCWNASALIETSNAPLNNIRDKIVSLCFVCWAYCWRRLSGQQLLPQWKPSLSPFLWLCGEYFLELHWLNIGLIQWWYFFVSCIVILIEREQHKQCPGESCMCKELSGVAWVPALCSVYNRPVWGRGTETIAKSFAGTELKLMKLCSSLSPWLNLPRILLFF